MKDKASSSGCLLLQTHTAEKLARAQTSNTVESEIHLREDILNPVDGRDEGIPQGPCSICHVSPYRAGIPLETSRAEF